MKDVTGYTLSAGDYVVLSANVSTASQQILFGKVMVLKPKTVNVKIFREYKVYYKNNAIKRTSFMQNVRSSARILKVDSHTMPEHMRVVLDAAHD